MTRDVVSALYDLGTVEAAGGDLEKAVRLLAAVHQHPLSNQTRTFSVWLGEPKARFRDLAEVQLSSLESRLTPEAYQKAYELGRKMELDTAARELLSAL